VEPGRHWVGKPRVRNSRSERIKQPRGRRKRKRWEGVATFGSRILREPLAEESEGDLAILKDPAISA